MGGTSPGFGPPEALRQARRGHVPVRVLCAVCFTAAAFFCSGVELAYSAFAPLDQAFMRDLSESYDRPNDPCVQAMGRKVREYRALAGRAARFAQNTCLWASGVLAGAGVLGMVIGYHFTRIKIELQPDPAAKGQSTGIDPELA
ncbi:hypothetical protein OJF2_68830 [Aquisphaera giovannonii]|uniref:Uncharacterized protein n=1 Tax=Aquisphaera giovannonii TaxID=406548 RepID=A0A5B9WDY9_9BACT|nr:hypothetical protein [Aquisphaera giovannonii]QEH38285.1 hypothetical protein OJF2_68830 [Aquisphaera giovannonii]